MAAKKILLPVDGSEHSRHACAYGVGLAKKLGASVVLLHAYGSISMLLTGEGRREVLDELAAEALNGMEPYRALVREAGLEATELVEEGRAADVIIKAAAREACDLVVMGSRGLSDAEGLIVGSVAHRVLEMAHCPVLIVR
ncbi:MAG: universal stress protein [Desulfovibrionaceae bacterium]